MDAVSRREFRLPDTAFRSSSRLVTGAATAVTVSTGVEDTTTAAEELVVDVEGASAVALALAALDEEARLALGEAAATTGAAAEAGAATGAAAGESVEEVFLATRLGAGEEVEVEAEADADIIPEDEELELILIRIIRAETNQFCKFFVNFCKKL